MVREGATTGGVRRAGGPGSARRMGGVDPLSILAGDAVILSEARAAAWKYAAIALAVLAVAAILAGLFFRGSAAVALRDRDGAIAERDAARAQVDQLNDVLATEREKARQVAAIAQQYEQDKADALDREAGLRADLRNGTKRLRGEIGALYTSQLSGAAAHSAELDAAAERGAEAVAAAVAVGAACDARDKAWKALAEADRR